MKWLEGVLMIAGMNNGDNTYEWTDNGSWDLRSFLNLLVKSEHVCTISDVHMEDVG